MKASLDAGELITLDRCDTVIDGLRVKTVGRHTFELVRRFVEATQGGHHQCGFGRLHQSRARTG